MGVAADRTISPLKTALEMARFAATCMSLSWLGGPCTCYGWGGNNVLFLFLSSVLLCPIVSVVLCNCALTVLTCLYTGEYNLQLHCWHVCTLGNTTYSYTVDMFVHWGIQLSVLTHFVHWGIQLTLLTHLYTGEYNLQCWHFFYTGEYNLQCWHILYAGEYNLQCWHILYTGEYNLHCWHILYTGEYNLQCWHVCTLGNTTYSVDMFVHWGIQLTVLTCLYTGEYNLQCWHILYTGEYNLQCWHVCTLGNTTYSVDMFVHWGIQLAFPL